MFLKTEGDLQSFEESLRGKKCPEMHKNAKMPMKNVFCALNMIKMNFSVNLIISMF